MTRDDLILAVLASADGEFSPVQIQKTLFLLDKKASRLTRGPHFEFRAYDYGPFDASIYRSMAKLANEGFVEIIGDPDSRARRYGLTQSGRIRGKEILKGCDPSLISYLRDLARFIRGLSFSQLVSAIYREFPEMKANSVFQG